MLDQISHLPTDLPAACISSLLNYEQKNRVINMVKEGRIQLLYITPESFLTDFMYHVREFPAINFICIDEAHSIS
jgi:ATP-dependent DNA helicase Q4